MKGVQGEEYPFEPPPGGLKRCSGCREYKHYTEFPKLIHYNKSGKKYGLRGRCYRCQNILRNEKNWKNTSTWSSEEKRARDRACTSLIKQVPLLFKALFIVELRKEYEKLGMSESEIQARLEYRTRYLNVYAKQRSTNLV